MCVNYNVEILFILQALFFRLSVAGTVDNAEKLAKNADCNVGENVAKTDVAFVDDVVIIFFNAEFQRDRLTGHRLQIVTAGKVSCAAELTVTDIEYL